jgi:ATP-dependent DNA helicase DinG
MDKIFSPSGLLAQKLKEYEYRPEQGAMAKGVARAFAQERFLIVEAGTGIGKSLAYLIPAALSGKRVIISTGTKTLQEQLFYRDVPFLQEKLGFSFRASFMKGRTNYLCRRQFRLFCGQPMFKVLEEAAHFQTLKRWAGRTATGDRAELEALPEDLEFWKEICASADTCLGQGCEFFDECFITQMRREAAGSDIVIVNHHLFFADLALRCKGHGEVLPRYEAVIFDEAHQLEEVTTQYFGLILSNFRFEELARDIHREAAVQKLRDPVLEKLNADLVDLGEKIFALFRGEDPRYRLREEKFGVDEQEWGRKLAGNLRALCSHMAGLKEPSEGLRSCLRRGEEIMEQFLGIFALADERMVYWCETRGRGVFFHASPVDVAAELQRDLYPRIQTAVFTSATLSAGGDFRFFKSRMGLGGPLEALTDEQILETSFDMRQQAILYLPHHLPDPNHPDFLRQAVDELEKILRLSQGRAFLLFTSIRNMEEAYHRLKMRLPFTCFLQGERPKSALIQAFKEDVHSVLFATASFWEGVDVRGEALSCVVVDRLPFSPPSEPILEARLEKIASSGGNPFWDYQVPWAIILLKQGLGRLIRTRQDRGVLAILDARLVTKSYGKLFLRSLPGCPVVREAEAIRIFFQGGEDSEHKEKNVLEVPRDSSPIS